MVVYLCIVASSQSRGKSLPICYIHTWLGTTGSLQLQEKNRKQKTLAGWPGFLDGGLTYSVLFRRHGGLLSLSLSLSQKDLQRLLRRNSVTAVATFVQKYWVPHRFWKKPKIFKSFKSSRITLIFVTKAKIFAQNSSGSIISLQIFSFIVGDECCHIHNHLEVCSKHLDTSIIFCFWGAFQLLWYHMSAV